MTRQAKTWGSWYSWKCCTICSLCSKGKISISIYPLWSAAFTWVWPFQREGLVSPLLPTEMKCLSFTSSCTLPILINKFPKKQNNILTIAAHWQRIGLLGLLAAQNLKSVTSHWIQRWIQHFLQRMILQQQVLLPREVLLPFFWYQTIALVYRTWRVI